MFGKVVFVAVSIGFLVLISLLGRQLVEFTLGRTANGDSVANYWGFWLIWLGPAVIGLSAMIAGVNEWLRPTLRIEDDQPKAIDSWVLPR